MGPALSPGRRSLVPRSPPQQERRQREIRRRRHLDVVLARPRRATGAWPARSIAIASSVTATPSASRRFERVASARRGGTAAASARASSDSRGSVAATRRSAVAALQRVAHRRGEQRAAGRHAARDEHRDIVGARCTGAPRRAPARNRRRRHPPAARADPTAPNRCARRAPVAVRTGLPRTLVDAGPVRIAVGEHDHQRRRSRGMRASRSSVCSSIGLPASGRYCLGMSRAEAAAAAGRGHDAPEAHQWPPSSVGFGAASVGSTTW